MSSQINNLQTKYISAESEQILNQVTGFSHGSAAITMHLIHALQNRHYKLKNVELVNITTLDHCQLNS